MSGKENQLPRKSLMCWMGYSRIGVLTGSQLVFYFFCWNIYTINFTFLTSMLKQFGSLFFFLNHLKIKKMLQLVSLIFFQIWLHKHFVFGCNMFITISAVFLCESLQFFLFICCWEEMICPTGFISFMCWPIKHVF